MGIYINGFSSVNVERQFNLTNMKSRACFYWNLTNVAKHGIHNNKHQKYVFLNIFFYREKAYGK